MSRGDSMDKQYNSKGVVEFEVTQKINESVYYNLNFKDKPCKESLNYCDIMSGKTFLNYVKRGMFTDYDGYVSNVFIDKYKTNIRLADYGIEEYNEEYINFIEDEWIELCNSSKVEVLWVNK